jgi:signal transduction histidine kinase
VFRRIQRLRGPDGAAERRQLVLDQFDRDVATEPGVDAIRATIASRVRQFAACESVCVLEHDPARDAYVVVHVTGTADDVAVPLAFAAAGPLIRWLRVNAESLDVSRARAVVAYLPDDERALLQSAYVRVCVPLVASAHLLGVLLLSDRRATWSLPAEVSDDLLTAYGLHAAAARERLARAHREREKQRSTLRAQQLAVAGQLAASVAHEVRNPLTAIRSSVQHVLESSPVGPERDSLLQQVIDEVDRINRTITGMLTLSRPVTLALVDLDFVELAEQSVHLMQAHVHERHVILDRDLAHRPLPVHADEDELRQVILNVLLNACQAVPDAGRIAIRSDIGDPSRHPGRQDAEPMATITITDTGPGMSAADLRRVFDPFFTTKPTGSGLGLPVCLGIMTRHHGQITIHSEVGTGTTVRLSLPLRAT